MTEYVGEYVVSLTAKTFTDLRFHRHEEIVRCKDCRYFRAETMKHPALCRLWISRALFRQTVTGITTYLPKQCKVKPDGFCAWGERKTE